MGADGTHVGRFGDARSPAALALFALALVGTACGVGSESDGAIPTPSVSSAPATTSMAAAQSSTSAPVDVPTGLPGTILVAHDPPASTEGQHLALLDRASGELVDVVTSQSLLEGATGEHWRIAGFDLSADGGTVAFGLVTSPDEPASSRGAIYLAPTDGSESPRLLTEVPTGVWVERFSPDGRWLVAGAGVWTVFPVDGGSPVTSDVPSPYPAFGLQWSADGTTIALGEHYERDCCPQVTTMSFDATARTLSRAGTHEGGTLPWFTSDGELRVLAGLGPFCVGLIDVDATGRWGLSASGCASAAPGDVPDLTWWSTQGMPSHGERLPVTLPANTRGIAW